MRQGLFTAQLRRNSYLWQHNLTEHHNRLYVYLVCRSKYGSFLSKEKSMGRGETTYLRTFVTGDNIPQLLGLPLIPVITNRGQKVSALSIPKS